MAMDGPVQYNFARIRVILSEASRRPSVSTFERWLLCHRDIELCDTVFFEVDQSAGHRRLERRRQFASANPQEG